MKKQLFDLSVIDKKITEISATTPYSYEDVLKIVMLTTENILTYSIAGMVNPEMVVGELFKKNKTR